MPRRWRSTEAGEAARGATVYVTLEPCAHDSARGPACADLLVAARPARVVVALADPDPRTDGAGIARLEAAGIAVELGIGAEAAERSMAGFLSRVRLGRPFVTLKLAMSIDGRIALASGESKWITGEEARAHAHLERALSDMILVGRGTYEADDPRLDVRLPGLEDRSPRRALLTTGAPVDGWTRLGSPQAIRTLTDVNDLLVEGGAETASSFLHGDLVDRLLVYRAPILIGEGKAALTDIGLDSLAARARPLAAGRYAPAWHRHARSLRAHALMFTGIITDIGRIEAVEARGDLRVRIACGYDMAGVDLGASIACSGVCLTVVDKGEGWFAVDVSAETQSRTAPGLWSEGTTPQPRARAEGRRRARRPYRHRPCRRARRGRGGRARAAIRSGSASSPGRRSRPMSRPRARSRSTACR